MNNYQYVYVIKELSKTYPGGKAVIKDLSLSFLHNAKIGIIGENGAGKSTVMKIIAGLDTDFVGEAWAADGIVVGYLPQEPILDPTLSVKDNILNGLGEIKHLLEDFHKVTAMFAEPMTDDEMTALIEKQGALQERIDQLSGWDVDRNITMAMQALRCPEGDISKLSGGEKRRIALCKLLLSHPDILLLDEPTNHLDAESVAWLEKYLINYKGMIMLVTHDRYFLDNVVNWILELDRGYGYPYKGNYSEWLVQKQKRLELEQKKDVARQKALERETDWIRQSPKARQAKSKARIAAYEVMLQESDTKKYDQSQILIPAGPKLGNVVIEAKHVRKSFGDRVLIRDLSFSLPRGGIVGVIGPNGIGKTTLFKMIVGREPVDSGSISIGESVKMGYVDQSREMLDDNKTVWEEIAQGLDEIPVGKNTIPSRVYCAQFNFRGDVQQKKVGMLSGGERNRVHLAKMLQRGSNLLLLDEPTNDLDIDTLRSLEQALLEFPGCAVIISHDRWFLDRIATHILAFSYEADPFWFEGNFSDYIAYSNTNRAINKT